MVENWSDAEVEAPASADYQAAYTWTPIEVDVISATGANHVAPGGVSVEALRAILDDPYGGPIRVGNGTREHSHAEPVCAFPDCIFHFPQAEMALERLRALLDSATTDGGES